MNEFVVVVDRVVRFWGTFQEAVDRAAEMCRAGERPVVRRARPGEIPGIAIEEPPSWEDDDDDLIPF